MLSHLGPSLSVIIPTRDRDQVIVECLTRLYREARPPEEVIVIDTSSTERTQAALRAFPQTINLRLGDIPFSMVRSRNVGLSIARGELVAYIDDDCFILPGWAAALRAAFADPEVVAAGGPIIYHPWRPLREGGPVATLDLASGQIAAEWDRRPGAAIDVPHLPGGNCAVRRAAALAVAGFDTNYTGSANLEETDFFVRLGQLGGRMRFTPDMVVEHRAAPRADGLDRSATNFIYRYSQVRNRLYFLRRHRSPALGRAVAQSLLDTAVGAARIVASGLVFAGASLAGLLAGLVARPVARHEGLIQRPRPGRGGAHGLR